MTFLPFLLFGLLIAAVFIYRHFSVRRERDHLLAAPLTPEQRKVVMELVPIVRRLPESLRPELEGKMNLFLDQITFHGNHDLEVTEKMKLAIAAQACLLIVNSPVWYNSLRTILIYQWNNDPHQDGEEANICAGE